MPALRKKPIGGTREARNLRWVARFEALTNEAIGTLERLMKSDDNTAALGAAKEVLVRALGKPAQTTEVNVTMQSPAAAHIAALEHLTALAAVQATRSPDPKPLISLTDLADRDKPPISHGPIVDVTPEIVKPESPAKSSS